MYLRGLRDYKKGIKGKYPYNQEVIMARKKDVKIAGIVTLYNPSDKDIKNISTYIDDIDKLYIIDNTEGNDNKSRIPKNKKIEYTLKNLEGKEYLRYEWIELDKLENYRLLPECMKDVLSEKTFPVHKIFVDKNGKEVK